MEATYSDREKAKQAEKEKRKRHAAHLKKQRESQMQIPWQQYTQVKV